MSIKRSTLIYNSITKCMSYIFCNSTYQLNELQNIDSSVPLFSLNGQIFNAKVVEVIDENGRYKEIYQITLVDLDSKK